MSMLSEVLTGGIRGGTSINYAALGETEQAFAALERAQATHDPQLQLIGAVPAFDPLRTDPRFKELERRIGLTTLKDAPPSIGP